MTVDEAILKRQAAEAAVHFVASGMVLGLGAGSTAHQALTFLGQRIQRGELQDIVGIPCSRQVAREAKRLGIPLTSLNEHPTVDLTIDGADEVDPSLRLIKGGGGALLHEKIVAQASRREIIVIDESKLSPMLGTRWALPVEVIGFGWRTQADFLRDLGAEVEVRRDERGHFFQTDEGNLIIDCNFGPIKSPEELATALKHRTGIVEHGLFLHVATDLIVAASGGVQHRRADSGAL